MKCPLIALSLVLAIGCGGPFANHSSEDYLADLKSKREAREFQERAERKAEAERAISNLMAKRQAAQDFEGSCRIDSGRDLSCEAIKKREQRVRECSLVVPNYKNDVEQQRKDAIRRSVPARESFERYLDPAYYEQGDQLDGLHSGEETPAAFAIRLRSTNIKQLECFGEAEKAKGLTEVLSLLLQGSEALRANEAKCRQDKKCMMHRQDLAAGKQICGALSEIETVKNEIQTERSNPTGVVSLTALHRMGRDLQMYRQQVKESKDEFRDLYKRQFPESVCAEIASE